MELWEVLKAVVMGVIEGATEFLPVSSTGHLIIAADFMNFSVKGGVFEVVIQTGAIFAIVFLYFQKLWATLIGLPNSVVARRFALAVTISFLPLALLGVLLHDFIKNDLFNMTVVAVTLILGGFFMLWVERLPLKVKYRDVDDLSLGMALKIGLCQCAALVPGVSRAGATIVGALLLGVERKTATEFSFYLAIPTLIGAAVYDLFVSSPEMSNSDLWLIAVGTFASFISAVVVVKFFIHWVERRGFALFAWYRIVFGALVLGLIYSGLWVEQPAS